MWTTTTTSAGAASLSGGGALAVVTFYVLPISYGLLSLSSAGLLWRIHSAVKRWSTQKLFHVFNTLYTMLRAVFFILWHFQGVATVPRFALLTTCEVLFFSTYLRIVSYWIELYHAMRGRRFSLPALRRVVLITELLAYTVAAFITILLFMLPHSIDVIAVVFLDYYAFLFFAAAAVFLVYGARIVWLLRSMSEELHKRGNAIRFVGVVSFIVTTALIVRAAHILNTAYFHLSPLALTSDMDWNAASTMQDFTELGPYFVLVDVLPNAIVVWMMRRVPKTQALLELDDGARVPSVAYVTVAGDDDDDDDEMLDAAQLR